MPANRDWSQMIRRMELLLRLKSFPVAFKLLEKKEDLAGIPFLRRMNHKSTLCQLISLVRSFDWTIGADLDDFLYSMCPSIIGLTAVPELMRDGTFRSIVWTKTREDGKKYENSVPRLPAGKYQAVALAPLVYNPVRSGHRPVLRQPRPDDAPDQRPAIRGLRGHAVFLRGRVFLLRRHRPLLSRRESPPSPSPVTGRGATAMPRMTNWPWRSRQG